jgi:hypothetical protein
MTHSHFSLLFAFCLHLFTFCSRKSFSTFLSNLSLGVPTLLPFSVLFLKHFLSHRCYVVNLPPCCKCNIKITDKHSSLQKTEYLSLKLPLVRMYDLWANVDCSRRTTKNVERDGSTKKSVKVSLT